MGDIIPLDELAYYKIRASWAELRLSEQLYQSQFAKERAAHEAVVEAICAPLLHGRRLTDFRIDLEARQLVEIESEGNVSSRQEDSLHATD